MERGTIYDIIDEFENVKIEDIKELTVLMKEELTRAGIKKLCDFSKIDKARIYAKDHGIREHTILKLKRYYLHGISLIAEGIETLLNYSKVYENEFINIFVGEYRVKSYCFVKVESKYPTSGMKVKICDNNMHEKENSVYRSMISKELLFKTKKDDIFLEILLDDVSAGKYVIQISENDISNGVGTCTGNVVSVPTIIENKQQDFTNNIKCRMIDIYFFKRKPMDCIGAVSLFENGIWYTYAVYQVTETTYLFQRNEKEFRVCETRNNEKGEIESIYRHEMGLIKIKCVEKILIHINIR